MRVIASVTSVILGLTPYMDLGGNIGSPSTQVSSTQAQQAAWLQCGLKAELRGLGLSCHHPRLADKLSVQDLLCGHPYAIQGT